MLAVACVAVGAPTGGAATKQRCGTAVLKDWSDGKLSRPYPVRCYQDALNRMPEDMRSYTTAPDDIQRALLSRLRAGRTADCNRFRPRLWASPGRRRLQ